MTRAMKLLALGVLALLSACSARIPRPTRLVVGEILLVGTVKSAARTVVLPVHAVVAVYDVCSPRARREIFALSATGPDYRYRRWLLHRLASCRDVSANKAPDKHRKEF